MEGDTIEINCTMSQQETSLTAGLDIRNLTFNIQPIEPFHSRINVTEILVSEILCDFFIQSMCFVCFFFIILFMFQLTPPSTSFFSTDSEQLNKNATNCECTSFGSEY